MEDIENVRNRVKVYERLICPVSRSAHRKQYGCCHLHGCVTTSVLPDLCRQESWLVELCPSVASE